MESLTCFIHCLVVVVAERKSDGLKSWFYRSYRTSSPTGSFKLRSKQVGFRFMIHCKRHSKEWLSGGLHRGCIHICTRRFPLKSTDLRVKRSCFFMGSTKLGALGPVYQALDTNYAEIQKYIAIRR